MMSLDLLGCSVCGTLWSEAEARCREARTKDRRQDLEDGLLNEPVLDVGNVQVVFGADV